MPSRSARLATPLRSALTCAFAVAFLLFGCSSGSAEKVGGPSSFRMQTLEGKALGPKDFPGQVVIVDFWATWCGPCHIQSEILSAIAKEYKGKGEQILGANVGEDAKTVRAFLKEQPVPFPTLIDPQNVADQLGIYALPTLMVVNKKGNVIFFEAGLSDAPAVRKMIQKAMA